MDNVLLFVDVETGGLDPTRNSLLSVSFMLAQDNVIIERKEWFIKSRKGYNLTAEALKVNKINIVEHDAKAKDEFDVANGIVKYLEQLYKQYDKKIIFVGQNTKFDIDFIKEFLDRHNNLEQFNKYVSHRYVDIMTLAIVLNQNSIINIEHYHLIDIAKYFDISIPEEWIHTASGDCEIAYLVYAHILKLIKG